MRKDIKINVDTQTDGISLSSRRLGISSENLQGKIIFTPKPFIDGICRMYIEGHGTIEMDKQEDCYTLDIKSSLLITPSIDVCFKITEPEKENGVPIYATKIMHFEVLDTIESNEPIPEQYPQWKDVLDNYAEEKKGELDTYTTEIQTDLKAYKKDLEDEMLTTKDTLTGKITATATEETNKFNTNAETKIKEYNDNTTAKLEEYNTNATNKVNEFNNNADSLENELTELAGQMPWNTTEIQDSIHIEDSAKYSRNKLELFGDLEQEKREGYNLFNIDTITQNNYILNTTGKLVASEVTHTSDYIAVTAGNTYLVTFEYTALANAGKRAYCYFDTEKQYLKGSEYTPLNKQIVIKPTDDGFIRFSCDINCTKIQCIEGTTAKDYEEYGAMPSIEYPSMPVVATGVQKISKCRKNLLKIPDIEINTGVGVIINVKDNQLILNGTATINKDVPIPIDLKLNGIVTFSQKVISGSFSTGAYRWYLKNGDVANILNSQLTFTSATSNVTNNVNADLTQLGIYINSGNVFDNYTVGLQVEVGDTATDYEPYTEETFELDLGTTELCKIVDENNNVVAQDRAVYKDGKWQFEKNIGKYILKNAVWNKSSKTEVNRYYCNNVVYTATGGRDRKDLVSNCFKAISIIQSDANDIGICRYNDRGFIINFDLYDTNFDTLEKFNEYIQNSDAMVYYPNKSVIYEDCTPAQSEVLDKLYKLSLQKGTNNMFVESENGVTTELQLTYMQDLMSQINELKQAMLNIGGN